MSMLNTRLGFIAFLMAVHLVVAVSTIVYFVVCSRKGDTPYIHGLLNLVAMLFMALAICIFRMVQLISTRTVKLIHTMFHLIVILLMSFGYYPIFEQRSSLNEVTYHHAFPALIVYAVYLLQFLLGLLVMMVLFSDTAARIFAAPFHNIIGVWLYVCMVGIAMTGWYYEKFIHLDEFHREHRIYTLCLMSSAFIVLALVLFPYFQWELVGDI